MKNSVVQYIKDIKDLSPRIFIDGGLTTWGCWLNNNGNILAV
jgi:hypothetical protein